MKLICTLPILDKNDPDISSLATCLSLRRVSLHAAQYSRGINVELMQHNTYPVCEQLVP